MSITLPTGDVQDFTPECVPKPQDNRSASGSNFQQYVWAGRHWRFLVRLRRLTHERAALWSDLERPGEVFTWPIDQGALQESDEGAPRVEGGAQLGTTLNADGLTAGYVVNKGAFVSVITNARRYLYRVTATVTASGTGEAALSVFPPLRVSPFDNDIIEIAAPKLDGQVSFEGFNQVWNGAMPASFVIEERG